MNENLIRQKTIGACPPSSTLLDRQQGIKLVAWITILLVSLMTELWAEPPGVYALRDARIVRVSGPVIEHGTVVVRDGLIESVGESVAPPADAWVIDCKGLVVYPGLIDALSTWGLTNTPIATAGPGRGGAGVGQATVAVSTTPATTNLPAAASSTARGPEDRPSNTAYLKAADQIFPNDRAIEMARNTGYTTAVTFPNSNIFSGQGSVINLAGDRVGQMVIADAIGQLITLRTAGPRNFPGSLMGTIAYIRQVYLDADHYKLARSIYAKHPQGLQRPAYDRTLEGVLASARVLLPAVREVEIERMLALAKELKLNVVLYGGHEAWRSTEILKQTSTPVLVSLKYPERARDADPSLDEPLRVLELRDKSPNTGCALAKAGVKFAFYSDGIAAPRELLRAVKKAIDAGLPAEAAVRALSLSAAEIYGVDDRLGSIDKGKIANLVVADGDLFAEKTKIRYVFVDGGKFEPLLDEPAPRPGARGGATP